MKKKAAVVAGVALCVALTGAAVDAHKPVTSKYTYTEDVYPILKAQCGGCHVKGGIAPMSLLTYEDARPWAESIRQELTAGRMPPWYGDPSVAPLRDVHRLSPRDFDVVLTWVSGGTPQGPLAKTPASAPRHGWVQGKPDVTAVLPETVNLAADKGEETREFVLRDGNDRDRTVTFADLLPGNPAIVHDATIFTRMAGSAEPASVLAVWVPGVERPAPAKGLGFVWRAGEQLAVRIHYKKNWTLENKPASDRSTIGLYLAKAPARRVIRAVALQPGRPVAVTEHLQGLAVRAAGAADDVRVVLEAVRPDGSRVPVAGFATRAGWNQRYWLARPVDLPKGTRLEVRGNGTRFSSLHLWLDSAPAAF